MGNEKHFFIELELPNGRRKPIEVTCNLSADALKWKIHQTLQEDKVEPKLQHLFFDGIELERGSEYTLEVYGIDGSAERTYVLKLHAYYMGLVQPFFLDTEHFDPKWHRDFRNLTEAKGHQRGGKIYNRPLGAVRFGIKVGDKYCKDDSGWLGLKGTTDPESTGWPVAYHGTPELNVMSILREGFDLKKCKRFAYGVGIYCTPNPSTALGYGQDYAWEVSAQQVINGYSLLVPVVAKQSLANLNVQGKTYKLIIQCRVNPTVLKEFGDYWTVPDGNHIRPYAICAYEQTYLNRHY